MLPFLIPPEAKEGADLAQALINGIEVSTNDDAVVVTVPHPDGTVEFVENMRPALLKAQAAAKTVMFRNNLQQVGLAFHNCHEVFTRMPAAGAYADKDGKSLLSWRVKLLPFLEEEFLHEEFRLNEPWDSEHNKQFLEDMPQVFET